MCVVSERLFHVFVVSVRVFVSGFSEIQRVQSDIRAAGKPESKYADVIREKPIRVTSRIVVPVRDHPKVR